MRETAPPPPEDPPLRLGISACLLGQRVRYDGADKRDPFLVDVLGRYVEFVPVCPEVELGLGIPREPIRLERAGGEVRLVAIHSRRDLTASMQRFARARVDALAAEGLSGYVLKSNSPSCGLERVKLYGSSGRPAKAGRGRFAEALAARMPNLPIEEEGRLADAALRENFIERIFAYRRLRTLLALRFSLPALLRFHTTHKLLLLAHSPKGYVELGRLVAGAGAKKRSAAETAGLRERYEAEFMRALSVLATPGRHANVLEHMAGYFKKTLDEASRRELKEQIEEYRLGLVPRLVPLTLIRHHARVLGVSYLTEQVYLQPHPKELMLRNRV